MSAASLTVVRDTVSSSVPAAGADHAIEFTVTNAVPAGGGITITPAAGAFTIPAALSYNDIDLLINGVQQTLAASAGVDPEAP